MATKKNETINCDVFCIGDFIQHEDFAISGNLYVDGTFHAKSIKAGGNIVVHSKSFVVAESLKAFGKIVLCAPCIDIKEMDARDCLWFADTRIC